MVGFKYQDAGNGPGPGKVIMRDDILLKMTNDPENVWDPDTGILFGPGPGPDGNRVALIQVSLEAVKDYVGPLPRWVTRRGLSLWDVVANQYEPGEPALIVTPDGFKAVDGSGTYTWDDLVDDYGAEDLEAFFETSIKFDRD